MMGRRSHFDRAQRAMARAAYSEMRRRKHKAAVRYRDRNTGRFVPRSDVRRASSGAHAGKYVRSTETGIAPVQRVKVEVDMRVGRRRDQRVIPAAVIMGLMFLYGSGLLGYAVAFALAVLLIVGATLVLLKVIGTYREVRDKRIEDQAAEAKALEARFWADLRSTHKMADGRCSYCYADADAHVDANGNPMSLVEFHKPLW